MISSEGPETTAPTTTPSPSDPAAPPEVVAAPVAPSPAVPRTRAAQAWVSLALAMLFLILVLVFILQNDRSVTAHFFTARWKIPLAVDLLLAAVLGGLVVFTAGSVRILQLRRVARRNAAAPAPRSPV